MRLPWRPWPDPLRLTEHMQIAPLPDGSSVLVSYQPQADGWGASLRPVPPGQSKQKEVRYLDIHEDDQLDEAQFADWVKQASQLPGERM